MPHQFEQIEKEIPPNATRSEASLEAERRIQQTSDLPRYHQNGDGSYQRQFSDRQGRDVTLRVDGNDAQSLTRVESEHRLHSQHAIRIRAADTVEANAPPVYHGKGEMGRANVTLEIDRAANGVETDRRLRLNDLQVNENFRNGGVGREMLNEAETIGRQHKAREIYGNFEPDPGQEAQVRSFYQERGYQFRPGSGRNGEVYKTLRQPESDGAALRRAVAR